MTISTMCVSREEVYNKFGSHDFLGVTVEHYYSEHKLA